MNSRSSAPVSRTAADVLRIVSDPGTPVFVTVHEGGRRRYGYWRPLGSTPGQGACYVALPTAVCDELYAAHRIVLGEPLVDPAKTTYRVRTARPAGAVTVRRAATLAA
ncbi:hypothetical protein [Streptomyces sp. NPDC057877]|uniref:hypothetical protein n=1 Tax=Streptomyces sp. NPDC057877 TaxID=3346269 RepID=UPI00368CBFFB